MKAFVVALAAGVVGVGVVVGCSSDDAAAPAAPVDAGVEAAVTPPPVNIVDSGPAVGPSPFLRIVNNLALYGNGNGDARVCVSVGDTQLLDTPLPVSNLSITAPLFTAAAGAQLVTSAVTFHLIPFSITSGCADAVKSTDPDVVHLPELPAGTFAGNKPYVVTFLGCKEPQNDVELFPESCSRKADGSLDGTTPTIRASVTPLDTSAVDSASIGFQFINASLGIDGLNAIFNVKATATGGWNDGPKPLGATLGFGENPTITDPITIPALGFLPPSTGGFMINADNAAKTQLATATAASFSDVTFAAGNRYILMNVGGAVPSQAYKLLAFALPTANNAPVAVPDAGAPAGNGPWVSFLNDSEDAPDFTPCFLAADNSALNPSTGDQGVIHPYWPTPIHSTAAGWTGQVRLVSIPKGSPHACDGTTSAVVGVDDVVVLQTFPAGTFATGKSYIALELGCLLTPFSDHPECYADWAGTTTNTDAQPSRRVVAVEVDGTSVGPGGIGVQFLNADPFILAGLTNDSSGRPELLEFNIQGNADTFVYTPLSSYASATSTTPQVVPSTALKFANALVDQAKALFFVDQKNADGSIDQTINQTNGKLQGSLLQIESDTTFEAPTFTFFNDGVNYVFITVSPAFQSDQRRIVAVPTRW